MEDSLALREEVIRACRWLEQRSLVIGTWGNLSVRLGDRILLTPSRVNYQVMTPEDLVIVDLEGHVVQGHRPPTSEKEVHRLLYLRRPDIGAIAHCHSECACAVSSSGVSIPPLIEEMSQLLGGGIPCTRTYVPAGRHLELGQAAAEAIGGGNALLLKNHGPVCCGRDLEEALLVCLVVEKAAKIFLSLGRRLPLRPIPGEFVEQERSRFLYRYGKEQ
jgi:L-ribulose-5-phosphate 4-epimerase